MNLAKIKAELAAQVQAGDIGKWRAFSELAIVADNFMSNPFQRNDTLSQIRWAAIHMDDIERTLKEGVERA